MICLDFSTALHRLGRQVPRMLQTWAFLAAARRAHRSQSFRVPAWRADRFRPLEDGSISVHAHLAYEEINGGLPFVTNVDLAPALRQRFTTAIVAVRALYAILLR